MNNTQTTYKPISYNQLFERIKDAPKERLYDIYQFVNFVIYNDSNSDTQQQRDTAKNLTEKYCPKELADELATDDYMIGKPFPYEDFDLEKAIIEDENDEPAPEEWVQKMFPKSSLYYWHNETEVRVVRFVLNKKNNKNIK